MKKAINAVAVMAVMAGMLSIVSPASAADPIKCDIPMGHYVCTTKAIEANSGHWIKRWIFAPPNNGRITYCEVRDATNGIDVDTDSVGSGQKNKYRQIQGLYSRYFMTCIRYDSAGNGAGGPGYTAGMIWN